MKHVLKFLIILGGVVLAATGVLTLLLRRRSQVQQEVVAEAATVEVDHGNLISDLKGTRKDGSDVVAPVTVASAGAIAITTSASVASVIPVSQSKDFNIPAEASSAETGASVSADIEPKDALLEKLPRRALPEPRYSTGTQKRSLSSMVLAALLGMGVLTSLIVISPAATAALFSAGANGIQGATITAGNLEVSELVGGKCPRGAWEETSDDVTHKWVAPIPLGATGNQTQADTFLEQRGDTLHIYRCMKAELTGDNLSVRFTLSWADGTNLKGSVGSYKVSKFDSQNTSAPLEDVQCIDINGSLIQCPSNVGYPLSWYEKAPAYPTNQNVRTFSFLVDITVSSAWDLKNLGSKPIRYATTSPLSADSVDVASLAAFTITAEQDRSQG